jgi:tRNA (guanine26-N2/guanine27-N2)-dimethyltransferase
MNTQSVQEGKATFQVGNAFYNPNAKLARDLGILAATDYRQTFGTLRVLDAMTAGGVRSLRYTLESQADYVWANDSNPEVAPLLEQNLEQLERDRYRITYQDANRVFFDCYLREDFYDLVDIDCFGSPAPFLNASINATVINGLIYLTSTDGRSFTGHALRNCLSDYGACGRNHPAGHEQGLRILIGKMQQFAATRSFGIEPVFAFFSGQTYRIMLRLVTKLRLTPENYGFLGYCCHCGNYQTIPWRDLGKFACPHDGRSLTVSGPMWLGNLHDAEMCDRYHHLAKQWHWKSAARLLEQMQTEAEMPPYFLKLGDIGRQGQLDIPKRAYLIETLQDWGYRATPTHVNAEAIKTDADMQTCVRAAKSFYD